MVTNVSVLHVQVMNGQVPYTNYRQVASNPSWASAYSVELISSFVEPGTSCRVYGCYQLSTVDQNANSHFLIQNGTCQYSGKATDFHCIHPIHVVTGCYKL